MSGGARQTRALRFVVFNQSQDLGLKSVLRRIDGTNRFDKRPLFEFLLNCEAEFSEFFKIRPRMKLQILEVGKNRVRFLLLC